MNDDVLARLAAFARDRIAQELGKAPENTREMDAECNEWGASFVTVRWSDGRLQGCIGSLEPRRPLVEDVAKNALAAAFADPRARGLAPSDMDDLRVEVSVLSPLAPIAYDGTEEGARRALPVGDGIVLEHGPHRATFLPQMWNELRTPREFLDELKRKARLPADFWSPEIALSHYTVTKGYA
jgi:AmmeMemoRadiSam system protein A